MFADFKTYTHWEYKPPAKKLTRGRAIDCEYTTEENKEFWDVIIRNSDGSLDEKQIYKELFDFLTAIREVRKVYMHFTNNNLSKCTYDADYVISKIEEISNFEWEQWLAEERVEMLNRITSELFGGDKEMYMKMIGVLAE